MDLTQGVKYKWTLFCINNNVDLHHMWAINNRLKQTKGKMLLRHKVFCAHQMYKVVLCLISNQNRISSFKFKLGNWRPQFWRRNVFLFFKYSQNQVSLFIFVLFSAQCQYSTKVGLKMKKRKWCAWDSNPKRKLFLLVSSIHLF